MFFSCGQVTRYLGYKSLIIGKKDISIIRDKSYSIFAILIDFELSVMLMYVCILCFVFCINSGHSPNGLDFGILKVGEESKQSVLLRNKGPYTIDYKYVLHSMLVNRTTYSCFRWISNKFRYHF